MPKPSRAKWKATQVTWRDLSHYGAEPRDGWLRLDQDSELAVIGVELRARFDPNADGRPTWTGLLITAEPGYELTTKLVRDLRLGLIARHGEFAAFVSDDRMKQPAETKRPKGRPAKRKEDDDQHYWLGIASDYRKVKAAHPERPLVELAALWNVHPANAGRRVRRARALEYLRDSE